MTVDKQTAHLEDWELIQCFDKDNNRVLYGTVTGHPKLPDGMWIRTSLVEYFDPALSKATTRNTYYTLGVEKDYEEDE